jgi:hypothetical protein
MVGPHPTDEADGSEMALLVEDLGTASDTAIKEYIVGPHPTDEADGGDKVAARA